jgi:hypothetical protein
MNKRCKKKFIFIFFLCEKGNQEVLKYSTTSSMSKEYKIASIHWQLHDKNLKKQKTI